MGEPSLDVKKLRRHHERPAAKQLSHETKQPSHVIF